MLGKEDGRIKAVERGALGSLASLVALAGSIVALGCGGSEPAGDVAQPDDENPCPFRATASWEGGRTYEGVAGFRFFAEGLGVSLQGLGSSEAELGASFSARFAVLGIEQLEAGTYDITVGSVGLVGRGTSTRSANVDGRASNASAGRLVISKSSETRISGRIEAVLPMEDGSGELRLDASFVALEGTASDSTSAFGACVLSRSHMISAD